jgi:shikimate dehydrogenase
MGVPYAEVIGDPVAHSKSPLIHEFWLEKLGLAGDYRRCKVETGRLRAYLADRSGDPNWRGCNLTMPLKQEALEHAPELDAGAAKAEAVNLLLPTPAGLRGLNTDVVAVTALLQRVPRPARQDHLGTYVHVVGAGGAARAAVIGAMEAGYPDFYFFNRTVEKAGALARWLGLDPEAYASPLEAIGPIRNLDDGLAARCFSHILINASSLGMAGNGQLAVPLDSYRSDTVVLDMVYGGGETDLVRQARELGLRTFDGLHMLVEQAAPAFGHFFGRPAPREHDEELRELLVR